MLDTLILVIPVLLILVVMMTVVKLIRSDHEPGESIQAIIGLIPITIIVVVSILILSSMASSVEDRDYELYDCVPLTTFGNEAVLEGDCIETVTIGGIDYVRMTDLGTFTATSGDSSKEYRVTKAQMDLVVWAGQSNSMRFTNPSYYTGETTIEPGQGFYFGWEDPTNTEHAGIVRQGFVDDATVCDIVGDDGKMRVAQMYPTFYGDYYQETGHRFITVSTGIGGRAIAAWDDGGEADVLMKTALTNLKQQCQGKIVLNPVGILWVQGESDVSNTEEYYLEKFTTLLDKFENGYYAGYKFNHILASLPKTSSSTYENMIAPAQAQIEMESIDSHFRVASTLAYRTTSTQMRDSLHFTQEYYGWVGEAFARELAIVTGHSPVKETIVLIDDPGQVDVLPTSVTGYGTSGESYTLSVSWSESPSLIGAYDGSLSGNPSSTAIASGLVACAYFGTTFDTVSKTLTVREDTDSYTWHSYAGDIKNVIIGNEVTTIGANMFDGSTSLKSLYIPSTVTSIDSTAFDVSFKDAHNSSITVIPGEYAGYNGTLYLADTTIFTFSADGSTITGLSDTTATHIVLPSKNGSTTVTTIGESAFASTGIVMVATIYGSSITTSGNSAFNGCSSLVYASLPELTAISGSMFRSDNAMTILEIPAVSVINYRGLQACSALEVLELPAITVIGQYSAISCTGITEVSFGSGLTSVADGALAAWTFYDTDGTTELDKTVASNLAGSTFIGTASALVKQA